MRLRVSRRRRRALAVLDSISLADVSEGAALIFKCVRSSLCRSATQFTGVLTRYLSLAKALLRLFSPREITCAERQANLLTEPLKGMQCRSTPPTVAEQHAKSDQTAGNSARRRAPTLISRAGKSFSRLFSPSHRVRHDARTGGGGTPELVRAAGSSCIFRVNTAAHE